MESLPMNKLLNIHETAEYLGVKVNTLYSWVHTRKIPVTKVGRLLRFNLTIIQEWLKGFTVQPWQDREIKKGGYSENGSI